MVFDKEITEMISDVLSVAIEGIDRHLSDECNNTLYTGDLRVRIIEMRNAMDELRRELDAIPDERLDKED